MNMPKRRRDRRLLWLMYTSNNVLLLTFGLIGVLFRDGIPL